MSIRNSMLTEEKAERAKLRSILTSIMCSYGYCTELGEDRESCGSNASLRWAASLLSGNLGSGKRVQGIVTCNLFS